MTREVVRGTSEGEDAVRYELVVSAEGDHWCSTLARLDELGRPTSAAVAPKFYGLTYEQARRRMLQVLENQYDDVTVEPDASRD